ncbi:MAG: hypothetical protein M0R33_12455 [Methylomonas sp.]|jgi:hypothetical protein|uniref:hypothetical protein n=1 Tax=Methylomonas sp. TaxID=418 RepID=UPI0025F12287|nr:hypothetical protein [Methylomonas sp.]MCK9607245.1 hypothetical protein [Methylomonas sp.]
MKHYNEDCSLCKLMRSMAFTGVGMGIGAGVAYLLGASRQDMVYSGIVVAAILIFGLAGRNK